MLRQRQTLSDKALLLSLRIQTVNHRQISAKGGGDGCSSVRVQLCQFDGVKKSGFIGRKPFQVETERSVNAVIHAVGDRFIDGIDMVGLQSRSSKLLLVGVRRFA
jgi:hypothetical protein